MPINKKKVKEVETKAAKKGKGILATAKAIKKAELKAIDKREEQQAHRRGLPANAYKNKTSNVGYNKGIGVSKKAGKNLTPAARKEVKQNEKDRRDVKDPGRAVARVAGVAGRRATKAVGNVVKAVTGDNKKKAAPKKPSDKMKVRKFEDGTWEATSKSGKYKSGVITKSGGLKTTSRKKSPVRKKVDERKKKK